MPSALKLTSVLLTYPQSDFSIHEYRDWFNIRFGPKYLCVSSERHEDGNYHRHVVAYWTRESRFCGNTDSFDYQNRHPNVQAIKGGMGGVKRSIRYVQKDGVFLEIGSLLSVWERVVRVQSPSEALQLLRTEAPRELVCRFPSIKAYLDSTQITSRISEPVRCRESFSEPEVLKSWVSDNLV